MNFKNKKVTVVGLGRSGFAAAKFLAARGARVFASDGSTRKDALENAGFLKGLGVEVETGRHTAAFFEKSALVVTSPGVPKTSEALRLAKKYGLRVISEIELASYFCPGKIIGVTGSNGKTTTCHLLHRALSDAGKRSVLCGNVGYSFLEALSGIDKSTWVVLELSSFQLEDSPTFRPQVAIILNVSPNHLDRHKTLANYARAKAGIFKNQIKSDALVLNRDNAVVKRMAPRARSRVIYFSKSPLKQGVFLDAGNVCVRIRGKKGCRIPSAGFALKGEHNLENIMAVCAAAALAGVPPASLADTLGSFKTLEHRVEPLGALGGVEFVNDSKSTTLKSTEAAIRSLDSPIVLVAGGRDKGIDFSGIEPLLSERVKSAVLYGEARTKISAAWKNYPEKKLVENFEEAVALAYSLCAPGDTLLLSPMCTSFDQFNSFEERGEVFKRVFEGLKAESR